MSNNETMQRLSEFHRMNLIKLAMFLEDNYSKLNFDMNDFQHSLGRRRANLAQYPECGASACAVGHGPMAGIEPLENEYWFIYCNRVFTGGNNDAYKFLFSRKWVDCDNTALGAAARIRYFLDYEDTIKEYYDKYDSGIYKKYLKPKFTVSQKHDIMEMV